MLGTVAYVDDFGTPRPGGPQKAIDILAPKRSLALAAEAGKVELWSRSAGAGCMLYLHGQSGTDYYYIHLNNDRTRANDNSGRCVAGTAYAKGLKDRATVVAGQAIGYVGDSGDADGMHAHLHFELHPGRKAAVDPYPWLRRATRLLFAAPRGMPFTLELRGTVATVSDDSVQMKLGAVSAWPMAQRQSKLKRRLLVSVPADATVQLVPRLGARGSAAALTDAKVGQRIDVWTAAAPTSLRAQRGDDLALNASLVSLIAPSTR